MTIIPTKKQKRMLKNLLEDKGTAKSLKEDLIAIEEEIKLWKLNFMVAKIVNINLKDKDLYVTTTNKAIIIRVDHSKNRRIETFRIRFGTDIRPLCVHSKKKMLEHKGGITCLFCPACLETGGACNLRFPILFSVEKCFKICAEMTAWLTSAKNMIQANLNLF
jgi:hypothetical protein